MLTQGSISAALLELLTQRVVEMLPCVSMTFFFMLKLVLLRQYLHHREAAAGLW